MLTFIKVVQLWLSMHNRDYGTCCMYTHARNVAQRKALVVCLESVWHDSLATCTRLWSWNMGLLWCSWLQCFMIAANDCRKKKVGLFPTIAEAAQNHALQTLKQPRQFELPRSWCFEQACLETFDMCVQLDGTSSPVALSEHVAYMTSTWYEVCWCRPSWWSHYTCLAQSTNYR